MKDYQKFIYILDMLVLIGLCAYAQSEDNSRAFFYLLVLIILQSIHFLRIHIEGDDDTI